MGLGLRLRRVRHSWLVGIESGNRGRGRDGWWLVDGGW